jgi:hypothetical protein
VKPGQGPVQAGGTLAIPNKENSMKFFSIFTPDPKAASAPPSQEHRAAMGKLMDESMKNGALIATGMLVADSQGGLRVQLSGNKFTVSNRPGPLAEAANNRSGFAFLQAKSREEVIEFVKNFLQVAGGGECEICQIPDQTVGL